jgi:DNA-binding CsgD family transcriptional regulator/tetratricopeptide (TPR) repeat protein
MLVVGQVASRHCLDEHDRTAPLLWLRDASYVAQRAAIDIDRRTHPPSIQGRGPLLMGADVVTPQVLPPFVGRSADRERLAAVLARLRAGLSAALVVSGDAGIGKTQLLQQVIRDAGGLQTIMMSGYESEVRLGFAALHRLVSPFLGVLRDLPEPQRDALATAFGLAAGPPPNRFLVGLATMTLLEQAARKRPLLCVIDDVQWVDQETLDTLAFVARRLDAEGVGLIFGLRSSGRTLPGFSGIPEHQLPPMSDEDMRSLLSMAAPAPPAPHVATRLITESEGNPLALLEYVASLSPERLAGAAALPPALPVSERLSAGFAAQIKRLPSPTRRMLLVLSAAGADDADAVSETCARLGIRPGAAEPALRELIISAQPRLVFRHPIIRSVVYENADTSARRRVHALLGQVAEDRGFPDAAAWHRACATSGPDEAVAEQLERTAARARDRGGYATEATYLTLAAQRSVAGTEDHSRRLLAAAHAHVIAGDSAQAERLLDGYDANGSAGTRAEAERVRAIILSYDSRTADATAMLVNAASNLPSDEFDLARHILCNALRAALEPYVRHRQLTAAKHEFVVEDSADRPPGAVVVSPVFAVENGSRHYTLDITLREVAQAFLSRPRPPGREPTPFDLIYEGLATRCAAGYRPAATVLQEALRQLTRDPDFATARSLLLLTWLAAEDLLDDKFEATTLAQMTASNRAQGALPSAWIGLAELANTETRHGNFDTAQEMYDEATSIAVAIGGDSQQVWPTLVELRVWQGREAEARSMVDTLIRDWGQERRYGSSANFGLLALTVLELSLRRYTQALEHASRVARDDPPGHGTRILPDLVEAAVRTGDEALAGRTLDELTSRATVAATPWAMGVLARTRALALSTSSEAEPNYQEALRLLLPTPLRTETARTHLLYGEWLRRRKRRADAGEQLSASLSAFTGMGATAFAQRAALELAATGVKPLVTSTTQRSALTPQERHVAELAAQGMTNSEISEQLFISASTVDYHLSKVFRKLEITSRRRLKDKIYD